VLLFHGFSADNSVWAALASSLSALGLRVIAPDLGGHGSTEVAAGTVDALAAPVLDLVRALGASLQGPLHLIGHSLGAVVASHVAEQLGAGTASLTLIAPAGIGREIAADFVHGMAAVQTPGELAHLLHFLGARGTALSEPMLKTLADGLARGRLQALAHALAAPTGAQRIDLLRLLERLSQNLPVRVYMGLQDQVIAPAQAHQLPARVAVHWLAQSGHMPMWDQPRELLDLLLSGPLQEVSHG
jgi:pyruvate dehydrogenase E2 component (dihydrolipoamide acetyltransferase)